MMTKIVLLFFPFFIFCQNVDMYLSLIYEGKTGGLDVRIKELISKYPNDPGVMFLKAITTVEGNKAIDEYNEIIKKFPTSKYAIESSVKIGEFLYSKGLYSQAAKQLRLIPRVYPRYPEIEKVVNLMSSSFLAIGEDDSLKYYLGIYQSMFPNLSFENVTIEKNYSTTINDPNLNLKASPSSPYIIQIGAFGNIQNANRLKLQVKQIGYNVKIMPVKTNGRNYSAVRIFSYKSKSEAEKVGKIIKNKLGVDYRVLYRPLN
jgi:hypothetical protein